MCLLNQPETATRYYIIAILEYKVASTAHEDGTAREAFDLAERNMTRKEEETRRKKRQQTIVEVDEWDMQQQPRNNNRKEKTENRQRKTEEQRRRFLATSPWLPATKVESIILDFGYGMVSPLAARN